MQCFLLFLGFHVRLKFHRFITSFKRNIELDSGEFPYLFFPYIFFFFFKISDKVSTRMCVSQINNEHLYSFTETDNYRHFPRL